MFHRAVLKLAVFALLSTLAACANGYERFYKPAGMPFKSGFETFTGEPRMQASSGDAKRDIYSMFEDGYGFVGESSFVGPAASETGATAQAKKVGAAVVILSRNYQSTATGAIPITTPTVTTAYNSGTVNAYGGGGYASGIYNGTTTVYGSETTYVPYSIDRYNQRALYFAPLVRKGAGVIVSKLDDQQKQRAGTNQGVEIVAVRKGSPAFQADMIPGDILLSANGQATYDLEATTRAINSSDGREADYILVRGTERITKKLTVPLGYW